MKRIVALLGLVLLSACNDPVAPPSPTPVEATETEEFTGTLALLGSNVHVFHVSQVGRLRVTLTSLAPEGKVVLSVGTLLGPVCSPVNSTGAEPSADPQISGTATSPGIFCISLTDVGGMTAPAEYKVTVAHS